jgi:hypothetical protein
MKEGENGRDQKSAGCEMPGKRRGNLPDHVAGRVRRDARAI